MRRSQLPRTKLTRPDTKMSPQYMIAYTLELTAIPAMAPVDKLL